MQRITPCLWFDSHAEEAAKFYTSLYPNSKIGTVARYGKSGAKAARREEGSVMTVTFTLDRQEFMGLNGGPMSKFSPAVSLCAKCTSAQEIDHLWDRLSDGGSVLMPLDKYPFSDRFGWLTDKYGVSWQLNMLGQSRGIVPLLMFVGDQHGKAEEAMNFYMSQFGNSRVNYLIRYVEGEWDKAGTVKHASFTLDGQEFMAIDSGGPHPFTFEQAISFIVNCEDQAEVDRFWGSLSAGGATNVCGWLSDRYGLPWQIVPVEMGEMMKAGDAGKVERVMAALLKMTKLDIAELKRAADAA